MTIGIDGIGWCFPLQNLVFKALEDEACFGEAYEHVLNRPDVQLFDHVAIVGKDLFVQIPEVPFLLQGNSSWELHRRQLPARRYKEL